MQQIFYTSLSPEEYCRQGKDFDFPVPRSCPNPACHIKIPPQKHGFYDRNAITFGFFGRILIRRYYCKYCGKTISYLPSFCLPYFQYTVDTIFAAIRYVLESDYSLRTCLKILKQKHWARSHLQFYVGRFLNNLNRIKLGLRQLIPGTNLPPDETDIKKGAREVLRIVSTGYPHIQNFSTKFHEQCKHPFLAP